MKQALNVGIELLSVCSLLVCVRSAQPEGVARADERVWAGGLEAGYFGRLESATAQAEHFGAVGLWGAVNLSDMWTLRGYALAGTRAFRSLADLGTAGLELDYVLDTGAVSPYVGAGLDALLLTALINEPPLQLGTHGALGVAFGLRSRARIGAELRLYATPLPYRDYSFDIRYLSADLYVGSSF